MIKTDNSVFLFIKKHKDIFSLALIFLFALTLLRSAFYGISSPDESFYLTIPYRILKGDALLVDEWHASQLSSFLLILPMKLYLSVKGNAEGMILYFRYLFVFCQTAVSAFTYYKLKKYSSVAAFLSALGFLLYVPETVNMLDYYTMSLMGFHVAALILFCSEKLNAPRLIFAGIVFACAVTAQPFNCLVYFIYTIAVAVFFFLHKKKNFSDSAKKYLSVRSWLLITAGIILVAIVFLVFLFSQLSFTELIGNIGNLFGGNDHTLPFANTGKSDMFAYMVIFESLYKVFPTGLFISAALMLLLFCDKKRCEKRKLWIFLSFAALLVLIIDFFISYSKSAEAYLFIPYIPFVMTYVCLMLTKKRSTDLFILWWTGIVYTVFLGIISQALDYIGIIGFVISCCALFPAFMQLYSEIKSDYITKSKEQKSAAVSVLCALGIILIIFNTATCTAIKFHNDPIGLTHEREILPADTVISSGPFKGVHTSKKISEEYNAIMRDVASIKSNSCERVLVAGLVPCIYFCFEEGPAAFTTWYIREEFNLYEDYYGKTDNIPQCIYVPKTGFYWGNDHTEKALESKTFFTGMFNVKEFEGEAGYILYVDSIK